MQSRRSPVPECARRRSRTSGTLSPTAYLRVLSAARLPEAHVFARWAVAGPHRKVLEDGQSVDRPAALAGALRADGAARRWRSWSVGSIPPGRTWPCSTASCRTSCPRRGSWVGAGCGCRRRSGPADQSWVLVFLGFPDAETAALSAELAADRLRDDPEMRRALAARLLARLRAPEPAPGTHDVYARVARQALAEEMGRS